jgi:hypothetical protein
MAFLAPFIAKGAASSLGAGLTAGSVLGGGVGFKAGASLLAPTLGSTLPTGSLLTAGGGSLLGGGGGLGALGGAGGLLGGSGALLPKFASLGGTGGSLLGGGGGSLLSSTGGLGTLKSGADLAAFGGKTLSPGQLEYLRAASASTKPNLVSSNLLPGPTDYVKQFLGTSGPTGPSTQTLLGEGLKMPTGPVGTLKLPTGPTTGLKTLPIGPETPISEGALAVSKFAPPTIDPSKGFLSNAISLAKNPSMQGAVDYIETHPYASAGAAYMAYNALKPKPKGPEKDVSLIRPYEFERSELPDTREPGGSSERQYFTETFTPLEPYEAPGPEYKKAAEGGVMGLAVGGPVETMAAQNAVGANTGYPMAGINTPMYSNPMIQRPEAVNVISPSGDAGVSAYSGEPRFARGGLSDLGDYSDGGRLLKGPGDGVSDSIPASIGGRQPARLADGEFVIPARIVSEIGNGSTEAGARKLYAMMDRVQKARGKTVGKKKVAVNTRADKHLPA